MYAEENIVNVNIHVRKLTIIDIVLYSQLNPSFDVTVCIDIRVLLSLLAREGHRGGLTVFSPAYLRHVGPTSLQFRIPFDVGIVQIHKL